MQVITCGIFLVFLFVGDVSEIKGPEWLLTYDSQQYDRYLYLFKIFFVCLHFCCTYKEQYSSPKDQLENLTVIYPNQQVIWNYLKNVFVWKIF